MCSVYPTIVLVVPSFHEKKAWNCQDMPCNKVMHPLAQLGGGGGGEHEVFNIFDSFILVLSQEGSLILTAHKMYRSGSSPPPVPTA
jgi:hypothetical protein